MTCRFQPRAHEHGGRYGQATIVRTYKTNSSIEIGVELTANHQGYFEFRLCEHNLAKTPETDECFDRHVLRRIDADAGDALGHRYCIRSSKFLMTVTESRNQEQFPLLFRKLLPFPTYRVAAWLYYAEALRFQTVICIISCVISLFGTRRLDGSLSLH